MITPVNNHLVIEPVKQESFVVRDRETYEEKGVVVEFDKDINGPYYNLGDGKIEGITRLNKGDVVFFDSWLAAKFPGEREGEYFWLVRWEDVRAIEKHEG